ncbi:hypothetical protein KP509_21G089200 [Ceratopteris richardii]|nr:hypothetical protein KP509_21G089200 [Ceratopteris richardii]
MDRQTIRGDNHAGYSSANQDIRVVTLEKHLKNAGCLKRWLCSLGLGQFKEVFDKKIWTARDLLGFK